MDITTLETPIEPSSSHAATAVTARHEPPSQSPGIEAFGAPHAASVGARDTVLELRDVSRVWGRGHAAQRAVDRVDLDLQAAEIVAIVGPSGGGKSTLGAILAGIDRPTAGSVVANGVRIDKLRDDKLASWRAANVGIVFQDFHLLPTLTAVENVELALKLKGQRRQRRRDAKDALARVGLADKVRRLPSELSGGEQQRVGIARALAVRPRLLVADEPTGSLDQESGRIAFELLLGAQAEGTTVVFITHDLELAAAATRTVHMVDGRLVDADSSRGVLR